MFNRFASFIRVGAALGIAAGCMKPISDPKANKPDLIQIIQTQGDIDADKELKRLGLSGPSLDRYWAAWQKDVTCTAKPEWRQIVEECANSKQAGLRCWALARLVEAGFFNRFPAYAELLVDAEKTKEPDWRKTYLNKGGHGPGAVWQIRRESPFWKHFNKTVLEEGRHGLRQSLYTVWSWNSSEEDKDLVLSLARMLAESQSTDPIWQQDPWKDNRFWLVMDWLCAHGEKSDWENVVATLPSGSPAAKAAQELMEGLRPYSIFWGQKALAEQSWVVHPTLLKQNFRLYRVGIDRNLNVRGRFDFYLSIGPDAKVFRCRPRPHPRLAGATTTGIRYLSGYKFDYPGVPLEKRPNVGGFGSEFVLN